MLETFQEGQYYWSIRCPIETEDLSEEGNWLVQPWKGIALSNGTTLQLHSHPEDSDPNSVSYLEQNSTFLTENEAWAAWIKLKQAQLDWMLRTYQEEKAQFDRIKAEWEGRSQ